MQPPIEQVTPEGYDLQFGTNVVGTSAALPSVAGMLTSSKQRRSISPSYSCPRSSLAA